MWPTIEDVEPLWMGAYHDGVLSGIASVAGRICWFQAAAETLEGQPSGSRYLLFELTPEEADAEQLLHSKFETLVGTHLCYHLPRESRRLEPNERWKEFYGDFTSPGLETATRPSALPGTRTDRGSDLGYSPSLGDEDRTLRAVLVGMLREAERER